MYVGCFWAIIPFTIIFLCGKGVGVFLFYGGHDGSIRVEVIVGGETVWLSQKSMAELFDTDISSMSRHIQNILAEAEVDEGTLQKLQIVNSTDNSE